MLPQRQSGGIRVPGPGSYGRNDAGDAGIDAILLSKAIGPRVRVQGMRYEGHGWDFQRPGLDQPGLCGARHGWWGDRLRLREQRFLARRHRLQGERPRLPPRRPTIGAVIELIAGLRRTRQVQRITNKQLAWETIALCASRICAISQGRQALKWHP